MKAITTISVTEVITWCYISTDLSSVGTLGGVMLYLHKSHSTISVTEVNTWCYISIDLSSVGTLGGVMILT